MIFQLQPRDTNHYILEVKEREENNKSFLTWDFKKATHFLVVMRPIDSENCYFEKDGGFLKDLNNNSNVSLSSEFQLNDTTFAELIDYKQYMRENRWYYLPRPMKAVVFSCDVQNNVCVVYVPNPISMSSVIVPEKLTITKIKKNIEEKPKFRLFKHKNVDELQFDEYTVKLSALNSYTGGIYYTVSNVKYNFPVTDKMTGKAFSLTVPHGSVIKFFVDAKSEKNYSLSEK